MSVGIRIDCDGAGCRERWNAANTNEERRLATAHFTTAEDIGVDVDGLTSASDPFYVDAWVSLPDGWVIFGANDPMPRFVCPACAEALGLSEAGAS